MEELRNARAATYLMTRERLDARKTTRNVQCNPPNVRCGNRCIPPTWDCRLKGQGADPHLRAVKTDPLGGLANIQRGASRVAKGVTRGNFSEVEGGKRAVIRGAVKIAPGNIQQKQALQKKLEDRTRAIGTGLLIVTGGLGIHALLMKNNTFGYRNGLGRDINNATRAGVSRVLDAVPVLGAQRARTRNAAAQNVGAAIARVTAEQRHGPEALLNENSSAGRSALPSVTQLTNSDLESHSNLKKGLKAVNDAAARSSTGNAYTWDERHRSAFWFATKNARDLGPDAPKRISVFAEPTAQEYLANQFELSADARGSKASLKAALQEKFIEERQEYLTLARQQGFRTRANGTSIDPRDLDRFIRGVGVRSGTTDTGIRNSVEAHVRSVLTREPSTYAGTIYDSAVIQFDSYYKTIARDVRNIPGVAQSSAGVTPLSQGSDELVKSSNRYRSAFLAREMRIRTQIAGDAHAELVRMAYYRTNVIGPRQGEFTITDRLATAAASELSGRTITTRTEAIQILNREPGFAGARLPGVATPSSNSTPASTSASPPKTKRPARRRSRAARISDLLRERNPDGTPRYATREAAEAALDRMLRRDDATWAPELIRTATYLTVRTDLRREGRLGKPCGASHIPKAHECRQGRGSAPVSTTPSSDTPARGKVTRRAVTAGVAVAAAAVTVGGLMAYKQRQTLVPTLSQKTINKLSSAQVKAGLDKLPAKFQEPARKLVGGAKKAAAHMALSAQGGQIRAVDIKNNFSTWQMPNGTQMSVGSVGDSLLTFGAERKGNVSKFPQYGLGFTIDSSYDAKGGMPSAQAKQLVRTTKAMYKAQLDMLPENAVMFAVPHKGDGKGGKRKSIYEGMGFKPIPGLKTDRLWALKNQGNFTEIPDSQMEYMAGLIRGDEAERMDLKCGRGAISQGEKCTKGPAMLLNGRP